MDRCSKKYLTINVKHFTILFIFSLVPICILFLSVPPDIENNLFSEFSSENAKSKEAYHVEDKNCRIPWTMASVDDYSGNWRVDAIPDCSRNLVFSYLNEDESELLINRINFPKNYSCHIYSINIQGFASRLLEIKTKAKVSTLSRFLVKCGPYVNFYRTLNSNPALDSKINYRQNHQLTAPQISALFIGLEGISRAHFHRSLPKTLNFLQRKGFVDFQGFHSLAPETAVNTAAMLTGLKTKLRWTQNKNLFEFNHTCASRLDDYLDDCPVIFKYFNSKKYLTFYMDNAQSHRSPLRLEAPLADFHVNSIFHVVNHFREKIKIQNRECLSNENGVQFMLNLLNTFLQKFGYFPYFSFNWFSHPFRDFHFSLANFDIDFLEFFENISEEIYSKSVIIISGDHGGTNFKLNYSRMKNINLENFKREKSLPPLFIYLPRKFPSFKKVLSALKSNSRKLVSAFDIHKTFRHILELNKRSSDFQFKDCASLFKIVENDRNCDTFGVLSKFCACESKEEKNKI